MIETQQVEWRGVDKRAEETGILDLDDYMGLQQRTEALRRAEGENGEEGGGGGSAKWLIVITSAWGGAYLVFCR